jgi:hypothetical protein
MISTNSKKQSKPGPKESPAPSAMLNKDEGSNRSAIKFISSKITSDNTRPSSASNVNTNIPKQKLLHNNYILAAHGSSGRQDQTSNSNIFMKNSNLKSTRSPNKESNIKPSIANISVSQNFVNSSQENFITKLRKNNHQSSPNRQ